MLKNNATADFLKKLDANSGDEYCLWRATKYLKRPKRRNIPFRDKNGYWCRTDKQKTDAFAEHLEDTFQPFSFADESHVKEVNLFLDSACQMDLPIKHVTYSEVNTEIQNLNNMKSPGYDRIDSKVIKSLPKKGIVFLTLLYNSILRLNHFPSQWKCAEIILIPKPNKPENCITSYRPISLLVTFSKVFERILLRRLLPVLNKCNIIPDHQFGFRHNHGTPEQCHRIVNVITDTLECQKYCSAVFLDVQQAFDRVWHTGLLYKIKKLLPAPYFLFFKSYLNQRLFYVKIRDEISKLCTVNSGIPQGSVLGPVLYTIFTSDMPTIDNVVTATYADDTAILATDRSNIEASSKVQHQLNLIETWLKRWNIKVNANKSIHTTFTMRRGDCPPVLLGQLPIPHSNTVKYLGMHLDRRLTWQAHIKCKQKQLKIKTKKMYWLIGKNSTLNLENKLLLYKTVLKPIWTYGIQLWGTASNSNIEILQRYQSITLRQICNAPWYISNKNIHRDLKIPFVKDEIVKHTAKYLERLNNHVNPLAICLLDVTNETIRLKRYHVHDLPFRV